MEYRSTDLNELFTALSKAQSDIKVAVKDSSNPFFKSKYANLQSVIEASRGALCANGLSIIQQITPNEKGQDCLVTVLGHTSGQWISSEMKIAPTKPDVQSFGSYITYLRRYCYTALVGVYDGTEDDDAEESMAKYNVSSRSTAINPENPISQKQAEYILVRIKKIGAEHLKTILDYYKIESISQLKEIKCQDVLGYIDGIEKQQQKAK